MRVSIGSVAGIEIRDSEADESDPDHEEQRAESQRRSDGQDPQEECKDEPAEDLEMRGLISFVRIASWEYGRTNVERKRLIKVDRRSI